jgi:hypothetical protein
VSVVVTSDETVLVEGVAAQAASNAVPVNATPVNSPKRDLDLVIAMTPAG